MKEKTKQLLEEMFREKTTRYYEKLKKKEEMENFSLMITNVSYPRKCGHI
jgi:hypothetical protein